MKERRETNFHSCYRANYKEKGNAGGFKKIFYLQIPDFTKFIHFID